MFNKNTFYIGGGGGGYVGGTRNVGIKAGKRLLNNLRFSRLCVDSPLCQENRSENGPL